MLALSACGTTTVDRSLSGASIGAGIGLAAATLLHANQLGTLLIGGAAGGVVGAVTDSNQIYLGMPIWDKLQR